MERTLPRVKKALLTTLQILVTLSLLCWIPPLAYFLGWVTGVLIEVLNAFIHHVSTLPAAVIAGLYLSLFQVVMLYAFIFLFYKLTGSRKQPV